MNEQRNNNRLLTDGYVRPIHGTSAVSSPASISRVPRRINSRVDQFLDGLRPGLSLIVFVMSLALCLTSAATWAQGSDEESGQEQQQPDEEVNLFGDPDADTGGFLEGFEDLEQPDEDEMVMPDEGALDDELVVLQLQGVEVQELATQIAQWSGMPVWIDPQSASKEITLVIPHAVTQEEALDLVFIAMNESSIGVINRRTYIAIVPVQNIKENTAPFIGVDEEIMDRTDLGMIAVKAYQLNHAKASELVESLRGGDALPQWAKVSADDSSNQLIILSNIGTLQKFQQIIDSMDVQGAPLVMETFYLRYRDAESVAQLIVDLFSAENEEGGGDFNIFQRGRQGRGGRGNEGQGGVATTAQLRVTFDKQHNSVTVRAEQEVVDQIRVEIQNNWDVKKRETMPATRFYDLENSDAIEMRDMLRSMFSEPDEAVGSIVEFQGFGGGASQRGRGGVGGSTSEEGVTGLHPLAGQFSFEADQSKNRLIVTARSPEYLDEMDRYIEELDRASPYNKPLLMPLRYANAESLAEQLNAIFAEAGTRSAIGGTEEGLSEGDSESPFASGGGGTGGGQEDTPEAQEIEFWWQSSRPAEDELPISNIIGRLRIVPIARQNALLILARPQHQKGLIETIEELDRPGRQVLIMATVAAASDDLVRKIGLRVSSSDNIITNTTPDNQIQASGDAAGDVDSIASAIFDTSTLSLNMPLNAVLNLLREDTDSMILSDPRVFTSDNQEAVFFDGQDIPFITDTQVTDNGQRIDSFDYRAVGIRLAVRPHITIEGNVDMHVNIELSSIVPGQTLFGGFIINRRETTSRVTVRNRQTIVVSGILKNERTEIIRRIPPFGSIPILKQLFQHKEYTNTQTELVAFITPIILDNPDQSEQMFGNDIERLNEAHPERAERVNEQLDAGDFGNYENREAPDMMMDNDDGSSPNE